MELPVCLTFQSQYTVSICWAFFIPSLGTVLDGILLGFSGGSVVKNLPATAGDSGSISGLGRSPGGGNGNPLQSSCLENSMDRGAGWATVYGVAKSWTLVSVHKHL